MKEIRVQFLCGKISLEGVLALPEGKAPFPTAIVCHPHPQYGGSMDNNVVNGLAKAMPAASIAAFKFNFRGVGGSQGSYDEGVGEQRDVAAALDFISGLPEIDRMRIGLAGYSAGAAFSLSAGVSDTRVKALALISPPLSMSDFSSLKECAKPKLLISGRDDDFIDCKQFAGFCESLPEPKCCIVADTDHFWWGQEQFLADKVVEFFKERL
jgi:alpha/beta superfamily hydrolase